MATQGIENGSGGKSIQRRLESVSVQSRSSGVSCKPCKYFRFSSSRTTPAACSTYLNQLDRTRFSRTMALPNAEHSSTVTAKSINMSIYKMNRQQIVKFCELYKENECLWKSDSHEYRDRICRANALQRISAEMNIEGFGPVHVAQKIKNLRTTYAQEMRKVRAGTTENLYKPKIVWFKIFDSFLRKYIWYKPTSTNISSKVDPLATTSMTTTTVTHPVHKNTTTKPHLKIEKMPQEVETIIPDITFATQYHNEEYDCFGNFIASSLKSLPTEYALIAQDEIMQVLLREKRKALMLPNQSQ